MRVHHSPVATFSLWSFGPTGPKEPAVLVEWGLVEQRYKAVLEVLDGAVARHAA